MATKRQIEEQDRASETRRNEAVGRIIDTLDGKDTYPEGATKSLAVDVVESLIDAIVGDVEDTQALRRKGWQSRVSGLESALTVVRDWHDLLAAYAPPKGRPEPLPADHSFVDPTRINEGIAGLEQRLADAFGPEVMPERHIRTVLDPKDGLTQNGAMCGATTGSWTHPGGANCTTCHAMYAETTGAPYAGPVAHGTTLPPSSTHDSQGEVRNSDEGHRDPSDAAMEAADAAKNRRDEPITPTVAREIRAEVEADRALSAPEPQYAVGDKVTVGGIEFTKHSEWPREADGSPSPGTAADVAALNLVDPVGPLVRRRLTLTEVQQHGAARNRGEKHRSVSQVEGYSDCGTRYALSDQETPAWWNVGGKALHRCVEQINHRVAHTGMAVSVDGGEATPMWLEAFDREILDQCAATPAHPINTWRSAKKGLENYDWWRVEGPAMVEKYIAWLRGMLADGWEIARTGDGRPVIELEIHTDVGAAVPNLSIIDLALVHGPRDLLLIVDIKAGGSAPKSTFQLGVYGWALGGVMARRVAPENVRGVYYRARTGEMVPANVISMSTHPGWPILTMHPWQDVVARYRQMDAMERQHFYQPNVTAFCGGCGVRDLCPAQAADDQKREGII